MSAERDESFIRLTAGIPLSSQFCPLTILDDAQYPVIEGLETFVVYLSSPYGAELAKPFQAVVAINDIFQDGKLPLAALSALFWPLGSLRILSSAGLCFCPSAVPSMQFTEDTYTAKEKEGTLHIPIFRTGDLSYESSVRCYTRSQTAQVTEDFAERRDAEESRVTFFKGEKVSWTCLVGERRTGAGREVHVSSSALCRQRELAELSRLVSGGTDSCPSSVSHSEGAVRFMLKLVTL